MKSPALSLALLLVARSPLAAQDLTHKAPPQRQPIAIVNARIHTISNGTIDRGYIRFENGRIVELGEGERMFDAGTRVISALGKHVYPGFVGARTQMGLTEIESVRATVDSNEVGSMTPEVRANVAVNPDSTLIPVTRSAGILTVGTFPTGGLVPGRASVLRMDGWTFEDMTLRESAGLVISWPGESPWGRSRGRRRGGDEAEQDPASRERPLRELFDAALAYYSARASDPKLPTDIRFESMRSLFPDPAGQREQDPLFIEARGMEAVAAAVHFAAERDLRPVLITGGEALLVADLLRRHDVPVVLSGVYRTPSRDDHAYDEPFTLPARLEAAGLRWCLASGEGAAHERNLLFHAGSAVAFGLSHEAAIRSITLAAAEILGVDDLVGSLEPGKLATLVITNEDPLEITTQIEAAFIDGRAIDLSNKQTHLYDKYREKYRQLDLFPTEDS